MRSSKGKRIVIITTATAGRRFMPLASFITLTVRKKLKNPLIKREPINERSRYVAISCFVRSSPAISISPIGFPVAVAINSIINVTSKTARRHKHDLFIVEKFFIKVSANNITPNVTKCILFIDGIHTEHEYEFTDATDSILKLDLDVKHLVNGLHNISYYLIDNKKGISKLFSSVFVKTSLGGNGIKKWMYRINGDESNTKIIELDNPNELFEIASLIPVNKYSIRTSCYEFRIVNNNGVIVWEDDRCFSRTVAIKGKPTEIYFNNDDIKDGETFLLDINYKDIFDNDYSIVLESISKWEHLPSFNIVKK